jgi:hypothetical protein
VHIWKKEKQGMVSAIPCLLVFETGWSVFTPGWFT